MHVGLDLQYKYPPEGACSTVVFVTVCIKLVWKTKDGPYV